MRDGARPRREFSEGRSSTSARVRRARGPLIRLRRGFGGQAAARQLKEESNFERLQSRRKITQSACRAEAVFRVRLALQTDGSGRGLPATGGW